MEVGGQLHAPAALLQRKTPDSLVRRLCGLQSWSGRGGEDKKYPFRALGNRTSVVQSVA
jgi:hypothetical protein